MNAAILERMNDALRRLDDATINLTRVGGMRDQYAGFQVAALVSVVSIQAEVIRQLAGLPATNQPNATAKADATVSEAPKATQIGIVTPAPNALAATVVGVPVKTVEKPDLAAKPARKRLALSK